MRALWSRLSVHIGGCGEGTLLGAPQFPGRFRQGALHPFTPHPQADYADRDVRIGVFEHVNEVKLYMR